MLNNIILIVLFICFVSGLAYVYMRLKEETKKAPKKGEDLQISPEEVIKQVEALFLNGDFSTGQKLAKKYLAQNPYHHELRKLLVKSYIENQKEYDAISNLLVLVQFYPDDLSLYAQLATLYKNTHQQKKAIHFYSYLLTKDKYDLNAMRNLAELYYNNKQKESALKLYKQLVAFIDDEEEKVEYYEIMGNIYTTYGDYNKAINFFKKVLQHKSNNIDVIKELRKIYLKQKDTENVIYLSRKLIDLEPGNYVYYEELINLLFHVHSYEEALSYAQKALELENTDVFAIKNLIAKIYIYTGKIQESINLINETIVQDPTNLILSQTLAMAHCMNKDFEMAKKVCNDAIEVAVPSDIKVIHNNLSTILAEEAVYLLNQGKTKAAFDKFTEAMQYNNENPEIYFKLATANRTIKNYSEAVRQCKRAIELAPEVSLYYETLADIYYELQNFIEAKKYYKEAVFIDPKNTRAHTFLGILQSKDKEHESAIKSLETAVSLDSNNVDIRYNLALAYEVAGKKDEAKAEYTKVLELNPNHKEAANNLKLL
ncbi:MAG: tetratricopeptide repeat protein [Clostridium sp.]|nr:tetratricopeptide repeat protein [Clostridium sp.]